MPGRDGPGLGTCSHDSAVTGMWGFGLPFEAFSSHQTHSLTIFAVCGDGVRNSQPRLEEPLFPWEAGLPRASEQQAGQRPPLQGQLFWKKKAGGGLGSRAATCCLAGCSSRNAGEASPPGLDPRCSRLTASCADGSPRVPAPSGRAHWSLGSRRVWQPLQESAAQLVLGRCYITLVRKQ